MNILKLKKTSNSSYYAYQFSSLAMDILGSFLTSDYGSGWPSYKNWVNSPNDDGMEGNATGLEKRDNNIIIFDILDLIKDEDEAYKNAFIISKVEFLKLLEKWEALYKLFPNEIMITYDNDKLTIEGID